MSHSTSADLGDVASGREAEIRERLQILNEQLQAFPHPTPADAPYEYEVEELEVWAKLRREARYLEKELVEIHRSMTLRILNIAKHHFSLET